MQFESLPGLMARTFRVVPGAAEWSRGLLETEFAVAEQAHPGYYTGRGVPGEKMFAELMWGRLSRLWETATVGRMGILRDRGVAVMVDLATEFDFENDDVRGYCVEAPVGVPMEAYYAAGHGIRPTLAALLVVKAVPVGVLEGDVDAAVSREWAHSPAVSKNETPNVLAQMLALSTASGDAGPQFTDIYVYIRMQTSELAIPESGDPITARGIPSERMVSDAMHITRRIVESLGETGLGIADYTSPTPIVLAAVETNIFQRHTNPSPYGSGREAQYYFCNNMATVRPGEGVAMFSLGDGFPLYMPEHKARSPLQLPLGDTFTHMHPDVDGTIRGDYSSGRTEFIVDGGQAGELQRSPAAQIKEKQLYNMAATAAVARHSYNTDQWRILNMRAWRFYHTSAEFRLNYDTLSVPQRIRYMRRTGEDAFYVPLNDPEATHRLTGALLKINNGTTLLDFEITPDGLFRVPLDIYEAFV